MFYEIVTSVVVKKLIEKGVLSITKQVAFTNAVKDSFDVLIQKGFNVDQPGDLYLSYFTEEDVIEELWAKTLTPGSKADINILINKFKDCWNNDIPIKEDDIKRGLEVFCETLINNLSKYDVFQLALTLKKVDSLVGTITHEEARILTQQIEKHIATSYEKLLDTETFILPHLEIEFPQNDERIYKDIYITQALEMESDCVIISNSGTGKTTLLKWLEYFLIANDNYPALYHYGQDADVRLINELLAIKNDMQKRELMPIYLHCSDLQDITNYKELVDLICSKYVGLMEPEKIFNYIGQMLFKSRIVFLLDGFDQVIHYAKLPDYLKNKLIFHNCRIIISTRSFAYYLNYDELSDYSVLRIKPFTLDQVKKYLGDLYDNHAVQDMLNKLNDVSSIPILLKIIKKITISRKIHLIDSKADIYREFVLEIFSREKQLDKKRLDRVEYPNASVIHNELARISFEALKNGFVQYFPKTFLEEKISRDSKLINKIVNWGIINELLEKNNKEMLSYGHQSFQEYFAASYLSENYTVNNALTEYSYLPHWRNVMLFWAGISKNTPDLIAALTDNIRRSDAANPRVVILYMLIVDDIISSKWMAALINADEEKAKDIFRMLLRHVKNYLATFDILAKQLIEECVRTAAFLADKVDENMRRYLDIVNSECNRLMSIIHDNLDLLRDTELLKQYAYSVLLAETTHEIRNPLVSIGGFLRRLNKASHDAFKNEMRIVSEMEELIHIALGLVKRNTN